MQARTKAFWFGRWTWRRMLLLPFILYGALCLFALLFANGMIFVPPAPTYRDLPGRVPLRAPDGTPIAALFFDGPAGGKTILYSHGNAEDLGVTLTLLGAFPAAGYSVMAYDYEGYGQSGGSPSEANCYRDIDAAYDWLTRTRRVDPSRIILYGRSVGSGPAVDLAARKPVGGLVLESGFTSAFRVLTRWKILPFDSFDNLSKIGRVTCPVLIIHATGDRIVPDHHGKTLYAAARQPKRFLSIDGSGHNSLFFDAGDRCLAEMQSFFGK